MTKLVLAPTSWEERYGCVMSKSHVVDRASEPTPAQMKEFYAQVGSGRITRGKLQKFLRGNADQPATSWEPVSVHLAEMIMNNFIGIGEATKLNVAIPENSARYALVPFSEDELGEANKKGQTLVAMPSINLATLLAFLPEQLLFKQTWYCQAVERAAIANQNTNPGYYLLYPTLPGSAGKVYEEQMELQPPGYVLPNAAEIVYVAAACLMKYDEALFVSALRCRYATYNGCIANVVIDKKRIAIDQEAHWRDRRSPNTALASGIFRPLMIT